MKKLTWTLALSLFCFFSYAQFDEWFGVMHGAEFYYTPEFGACTFDNPFEDYAYSDLLDDICVSVSSNGLPDSRMESLYITPEGEVMIGTHSGFAIYNPNQSWRTYNIKTSMLDKTGPVEAIFKDSFGEIWVSLEVGGIYRLLADDPQWSEWRFYPAQGGTPFFGTAFTFREDFLGDIWACGSFGIGHYDRDLDTWTFRNSTNSGLTAGNYRDFVFDDNFNIWAAHEWDGLVFFNPGTVQVTKYNSGNSDLPSNFLTSLYFEEDEFLTNSKVWYGSADVGIGYFEPMSNTWMNWAASDFPEFFSGQVQDIAREPNEGAFWISTMAGITKFDNNTFETFNPSNNGFHALQSGDIGIDTISGQVWALSVEDGPGIYYPWGSWGRLDRFNNGALNTNAFRKVAISPSGEAWVVGRDNPGVIGLYRSNRMRNASFGQQGLSFITNDITFKEDKAYVATDNGFWSFDWRLLSEWTHHTNNDELDEVVAIETDPAGNIWLCTKNGLFKYDGNTYTNYTEFNSDLPDDWVTHITFEPDGSAWIGTNSGGVARKDADDNWSEFINTSTSIIQSNQIWEVFWDPAEETLWAATENGLFSYDVPDQSSINWPDMSTSPLGSRYRTVVVDSDGTVYAGSLVGFGILDQTFASWDVYDDTNSALGDKPVNDIAIDREGNKWMIGFSSTKGGLFRFNDGGPGYFPEQVKLVRGQVFYDDNQNGNFDPSERPASNAMVKLVRYGTSDVRYKTTDENGFYQFTPTIEWAYEMSVIETPDYFATTTNPFDYIMNFDPGSPNPDTLQPIGIHNLIEGTSKYQIDFVPLKYRCNEEIGATFTIKNVGDQPGPDPEFALYYDQDLTNFQASVFASQPNTVGNGVFWNPENPLRPLETWITYNIFDAPSENNTGDILCFEMQAIDSFALLNPILDFEVSCDTIKCGFDPNDKLVDPPGIGDNNATHPDSTLTYTVRFQNTGNDYAYNVSIVDTLDPNLDIESFSLLSASHPVLIDIRPGNVLNFSFPGIMLPDSATNFIGSQGYVRYSVNAFEDVPENTMVTNTAYIFFDQNSPIQTNTVFNTLTAMLTSVHEPHDEQTGQFTLFPNPAHDEVNIEFENFPDRQVHINVYTILGEKVRSHSASTASRFVLESDGLLPGVYTIEITGPNSRNSKKLIIH
ncbi:MAG: T9SS type A sorting domain-containing protein [Bacteroidota bacterium]